MSLVLVACDGSKQQSLVWSQEQEKIELSHQVELENYRFIQADNGELVQLEQLRTQINRNSGTLTAIQQRKAVATEQLDLLKTRWTQLRLATVTERRRLALGKNFDRLGLVSGRQFEKVSIVSIDDTGVAIRHANGSARLRYSDLDESQRVLFGVEADTALAALEKEAAVNTAYEKAIVKSMAAIEETKALETSSKKVAAMTKLAKLEERTALNAQLANTAESIMPKPRELAEPAVPVGSRNSRNYYGDSYYRNHNRSSGYVYYYTPPVYSGQPYFGKNPNQTGFATPTYPQYSTPSYSLSCEP